MRLSGWQHEPSGAGPLVELMRIKLLPHLALLVRDYEDKHYPIDLPDPVEVITFRMEQIGLTRKDLEKYIGSRSKVSEVLSGKRRLSLSMIRALHDGLGIPAEVLLGKPGKPEFEKAA